MHQNNIGMERDELKLVIGNPPISDIARIEKDLYIFDVDDTLIDTTAKVRIVNVYNQIVARVGTKTYNAPKTAERLLDKGLRFDYSEFNSLEQIMKEPKRTPFTSLISAAATKGDRCYIITAREDRNMLWLWLKSNGVNIPADNIIVNERVDLELAEWKKRKLYGICAQVHNPDFHNLNIKIWEDDEACRQAMMELNTMPNVMVELMDID